MQKGQTFLIVGLGLMGGSYACGLTKKGHSVYAVDTNPESISWAEENGIIKGGGTQSSASLVGRADYIVLALYPADILGWIKSNKQKIKPGAIITDLAGVKLCFLNRAQQILLPNNEFIACHPMAGKEKSGVQNASESIFSKANFLICPTEKNTEKGIEFAKSLAKELGFKNITQLSPEMHDRLVAHVSQLTHAIAVSLVNTSGNPLLPVVTGDSFRELTRIADINELLWSELFLANKHLLINEINSFAAQLQALKTTLEENDKEGLKRLFIKSTARRRQFDKK